MRAGGLGRLLDSATPALPAAPAPLPRRRAHPAAATPAVGLAALGRLAARSALAAAALSAALSTSAAAAAPVEAEPVLFVQRGALWLVEGKAAARQLGALPAELGAAISLQTDAAARVVLVGSELRWYWSPLRSEAGELGALAFRKLPCTAGPATLSPDGSAVLCATTSGASVVVQLATGKQIPHHAPIEQTAIAGTAAELRLIWADEKGIWAAPLSTPKVVRQVAPEAPRSGLSVSPTGERAVGVYLGLAHHGKNVTEQDMLFGFALDGRAARRKAIQRGAAITWSSDGRWVLVQDGEAACIMAATGGQYKCWKGYRGAAISRDGRFALLLGNRGDKHDKDSRADKKDRKDAKGKSDDKHGKAKVTKIAAKDGKDTKAGDKPDDKPTSVELTRLAKAPTSHTSQSPGADHATDIDTLIESIESYEDEGDEPDLAPSDGGEGGEGGEGGTGEGGENGTGETTTAPSSLTGELHLYRAALEGAFTTTPIQLAPIVDGPATFCGPLR